VNLRIDWNETYSIGIPLLDAQHQVLFDIANSIPETVDEKKARTCIVRLFKYAREHFTAEEAEMRKIAYPKLDEHIRIHDALIEKLSDVAISPLDTDEANLALKRFVLHWIVDHIMIRDKDISRHIAQQG
jgi:hemerythrin